MSSAAESVKPPRLVSLDAYRGFIMLVLAASGFGIAEVARKEPYVRDSLWQRLYYQFEHVQWGGCGFWDLIQPSFMFMVGVAMPFSFANRRAKGDCTPKIVVHTIIRAFILVALGVFLASTDSKPPHTNFVFTNVLAQIGLGYCFVALLLGRGLSIQLAALAVILVGYGCFFAFHELPADGFDYATVGIKQGWLEKNGFTGEFAHWNKNTNAAHDFDVWFLNLFPRAEPFRFNPGGYATLNFIPSMATMILGLMAGEMLRGPRSTNGKFLCLLAAGVGCLLVGFALDQTICPSVKRIWTPSWAIFSSGWTFLMLAAFFGVIDVAGFRRWSFPLVVAGMNSIAIYLIAQLLKPWVRDTLKRHFGSYIFDGTYFGHEFFSADFAPIAQCTAFMLVVWLACVWMYRQKIFVKI